MANEYYRGMLQHTIVSNISSSIITNYETDNAVYNCILSFVLMSFISYCVTQLNKYISFIRLNDIKKIVDIINNINILNRYCKNSVKIEFTAKSSGDFYEYSDCYLSILHYINTTPEISSKITSVEELKKKPKWFNIYYDEDDEEENKSKDLYSKKDIIYRITQSNNIHLNEHIICWFNDKNIEKSKKNNKDEYQTVNIECQSIVLSTTSKDIKYLQDFVDKIYSDYIDFKNDSAFKGKMYYSYEGLNEKKRAIWKEFPWHTNKTYDNIFLENKEQILGNIHKLTNMKKFNKRIGRPNQMNILIWGNDFGCGKTSLLKAICNVEFPERHIVNINLSKIKTCKELEDIFMNPSVNGRKLKIKQCIFIIDELEKCCPVILKNNETQKDDKDYNKLLKKYASKLKIDEEDDKEFSQFFEF